MPVTMTRSAFATTFVNSRRLAKAALFCHPSLRRHKTLTNSATWCCTMPGNCSGTRTICNQYRRPADRRGVASGKTPATRRVRHLEPESGLRAIFGSIAIPRFAASPYRLHCAIHSRLVLQGRAPSETDGLPIPFQCLQQNNRRDRNLVFGSRSRRSPSRFGFGAETDFRPALSEFAESPSGCQRRFGLLSLVGRVFGFRVAGTSAMGEQMTATIRQTPINAKALTYEYRL